MADLWTWAGFVGIALSAFAYVPQVVHLAKEHCSAGVSTAAWALWVASSVLIGTQAIYSRNGVFCVLQAMNLAASLAILFLGYRYSGMVCNLHRHQAATAPHR